MFHAVRHLGPMGFCDRASTLGSDLEIRRTHAQLSAGEIREELCQRRHSGFDQRLAGGLRRGRRIADIAHIAGSKDRRPRKPRRDAAGQAHCRRCKEAAAAAAGCRCARRCDPRFPPDAMQAAWRFHRRMRGRRRAARRVVPRAIASGRAPCSSRSRPPVRDLPARCRRTPADPDCRRDRLRSAAV